MVLAGYGSNDNRLKVWGKVEWLVCYSDSENHHHVLPYEVHQFWAAL